MMNGPETWNEYYICVIFHWTQLQGGRYKNFLIKIPEKFCSAVLDLKSYGPDIVWVTKLKNILEQF